MQRVTTIVRKAECAGRAVIDTITLPREQRARRRVLMTADSGREFLLDLPEVTYVADGDAFQLDDGLVVVKAMPEPLLEVRAATPLDLMKIAWHLGNRHTPAEITDGALYVMADHVLAAMVEGLGGRVRSVIRPFEPEGGAYGGHGHVHPSHHHGQTGHWHTSGPNGAHSDEGPE